MPRNETSIVCPWLVLSSIPMPTEFSSKNPIKASSQPRGSPSQSSETSAHEIILGTLLVDRCMPSLAPNSGFLKEAIRFRWLMTFGDKPLVDKYSILDFTTVTAEGRSSFVTFIATGTSHGFLSLVFDNSPKSGWLACNFNNVSTASADSFVTVRR